MLPTSQTAISNGIGTRHETSLHASLKAWYAGPGDSLEKTVDGYQVDIVQGDLLVEIQTRNFAALRPKLSRLLENHPVRLVHPIPQEKWILRLPPQGDLPLSRRKSPRRGRLEHVFIELVRIPALINHPNFSLEILLTQEEQIWRDDGCGSWRRKGWSISDRRLLSVVNRVLFHTPGDFAALLPTSLSETFTNRDLSVILNIPRNLAQKMVYCLRAMGVVEITSKRGRFFLYSKVAQLPNSA